MAFTTILVAVTLLAAFSDGYMDFGFGDDMFPKVSYERLAVPQPPSLPGFLPIRLPQPPLLPIFHYNIRPNYKPFKMPDFPDKNTMLNTTPQKGGTYAGIALTSTDINGQGYTDILINDNGNIHRETIAHPGNSNEVPVKNH